MVREAGGGEEVTDADAVALVGLAAMCLENDELPREYVDAVMRARHALRVKAQLVEALAKWDSCQSSACLNGGVCLGCANGMRAALQAAKETP
jgi:hypothetical protein